jgi:hypothetical protein
MISRPYLLSPNSFYTNKKCVFYSLATAFSLYSIFSRKNTIRELDAAMAEAKLHIALADSNEKLDIELDTKVSRALSEADQVLKERNAFKI